MILVQVTHALHEQLITNLQFLVTTTFTKTDPSGTIITTKITDFNPLFWRATPDNGFITTTGNSLIKTDCEGNYTYWDTVNCPAPAPQDTIIDPIDTSTVSIGRVDLQQTSSVVVFPNPTEGVFTVTGIDISLIEIVDMTGKFILREEEAAPSTIVDLSGYKKGLYFVKVITNSVTSINKVIVQ
ncbi:MAG: hypothetical protein CL842_01130 [Crocinitomicaceae bacterium]|nr:hypothetical protein [Crocinitomicaceae bacterium]